MHIAQRLLAPVVILLLAACASAPAPVERVVTSSATEISQSIDEQQLISLLQKLDTEAVKTNPQAYQADLALKPTIQTRLTELQAQTIETSFNETRNAQGLVPLSSIGDAEQQIQAARPYVTPTQWNTLTETVQAEKQQTDAEVSRLEKQYKEGGESTEQLELIKQLFTLTGLDSWSAKRESLLTALLEDVRNANVDGEYDAETLDKITLLKQENVDDAQLSEELVTVNTTLFENEYFESLSEGNTDRAYDLLMELSKTDQFDEVKGRLSDATSKMAELFVAMANESVADPANLDKSYVLYSQARQINEVLSQPGYYDEGHLKLNKQLEQRQKDAARKQYHGMSLAYLYMIDEFSPNNTSNKRKMREVTELIVKEAQPRVSTTDFENADASHDYGDVMSSAITQYLFMNIPHDVRVIEREQYEAIQREKSLRGSSNEALVAVDLLITGSVLEAKVATTKTEGRKMQQVEVGTETVANPGYIAWLEMSAKDREKIPKPSDTISISKKENIVLNTTKIKKEGIFSVSYRLVDASSGRIIFPDSLSLDDSYNGTSREGVEMGDFVLPAEWAELPSDIKILDGLAKEAGQEIGAKLVEQLENQDERHLQAADRHGAESNCHDEIDSLGKALVLKQLKDLEAEFIVDRLIDSSLDCGI